MKKSNEGLIKKHLIKNVAFAKNQLECYLACLKLKLCLKKYSLV